MVYQQLHIPKQNCHLPWISGDVYEHEEKRPLSHTAQGLHPLKGCAVRGIARKGEKVTSLVRTLKNPNVFCHLFVRGFAGDLHQTSWV
jgi:hypothetical protein